MKKLLALLFLLYPTIVFSQPIPGRTLIRNTAPDEAVAVRCVSTDGTTFEACGGSGSSDGIVKDGAGDTTEANVSSGRLHVDGSGVTQPVSAATLPLPSNAAQETGGNLATVKTNTDPLVASGAGGYVRQDSTDTIAKETGGNLATVKTNTDPLVASGGGGYVRQDSTATIAKETGGNLADINTRLGDPCRINAKTFVGIDQVTSTQLVTGVAAKKIYICSVQLVTATSQNVVFVAGTGTTCGTTTVAVPGLSGGATADEGWNFGKNAGIAFGTGGWAIAATTVNQDNLCLLQSSSGQVSGGFSYVTQ